MRINIKNIIEQLTVTDLTQYLKVSDIKPLPKIKVDMVNAIEKIITDECEILKIWRNLDACDKELVEEFVRSEGSLDAEEIDNMYKKHGVNTKDAFKFSYYRRGIFFENSKANLFFLRGKMPENIYNIIKGQLKEIEVKFQACNIDAEKYIQESFEEEEKHYISIREDFEKDFLAVIKLANSRKLKVTEALGLPNKGSLVKINEVLKNKEIFGNEITSISDIKNAEKSTRLYAIFSLLINGDILEIQGGNATISCDTEDFLDLNMVEKCKYLLDTYLDCDINELARIREMKLRTENEGNLEECRKVLLNYLMKAPIDEWIDIKQFLNVIKKTNKKFLVKTVGEILKYDDYNRYYYGTNTWEVSKRFIDIVLIEYLSTIGIVDLIIKDDYNDYDVTYFTVEYFKLTPLGAHILGLNNEYENNIVLEDRGIIIQPNFEIMVPEGSRKDSYCLQLDTFAEKKCEDMMNIYELNFKAMIKALDDGISIEGIIEYLKEISKDNIPANVLDALEKWNADSKRIKIRTVTIVETDDKYLLEELKSYKGINKYMQNELPYVFEIEECNANKVKREIEKKGRFCIK